jgi:hypothetical protein
LTLQTSIQKRARYAVKHRAPASSWRLDSEPDFLR